MTVVACYYDTHLFLKNRNPETEPISFPGNFRWEIFLKPILPWINLPYIKSQENLNSRCHGHLINQKRKKKILIT